VAILEDHPLMRATLAETLTRAGHAVVAASGALEPFLQALAAHGPRVALVDLRLERADGSCEAGELEALQVVHATHPEVRVLVLSARRDPATVQRCFRLGAAGYLAKAAVDGASLVRAVEALDRGERLVPQEVAGLLEDMPDAPHVPPAHAPQLGRLTPREWEVLRFISRGDDNLKIGAQLSITERTVKAHMTSLYRKLGPENRAQLALLARQMGVRPPEE
jgi:DNA-binding NarL/FixJ family response regulator